MSSVDADGIEGVIELLGTTTGNNTCITCGRAIEAKTHVLSLRYNAAEVQCHATCVMELLETVAEFDTEDYVTIGLTPHVTYGSPMADTATECLGCSGYIWQTATNYLFIEADGETLAIHDDCWDDVADAARSTLLSDTMAPLVGEFL